MKEQCPTLTFTGCKYMFHTTYNRYLTTTECLSLQGFPKNFKNVVGDVKLCNQIGNSMSVNVLKEIIKRIIQTTNLV
jgi:site-specific DNA-cytosine methylase